MMIDPRTIDSVDDVDKLVLPRKGPQYRDELRQAVQEKVDEQRRAAGELDDTTTGNVPGNGNAENQNLSPEEQTFKKRYGDLRRYNESMRKEFQTQIDELKRQLEATTNKSMQMPRSREEVQAWINKYPDVAAIVETIAINKANESSAQVTERMKGLEDEANEARRLRAETEIRRLHPDFDKLIATEDFHQWAELQRPQVQEALYDNPYDFLACSDAIKMYKQDRNITPGKKTDLAEFERQASRAVKTGNTQQEPTNDTNRPLFKESEVAKMKQRDYERNEDAIIKAMREGRFLYDLSGKN